MIRYQNNTYYPLQTEKIAQGHDTVWEKGGRSWFLMELDVPNPFRTSRGQIFLTADDERLIQSQSKYKGV